MAESSAELSSADLGSFSQSTAIDLQVQGRDQGRGGSTELVLSDHPALGFCLLASRMVFNDSRVQHQFLLLNVLIPSKK